MTTVAWPAELPQYAETWDEQHDSQIVRSKPDQGPSKVRRRMTYAPRTVNVTMTLTHAQFNKLRDFFDNDLGAGVNSFSFVHPFLSTSHVFGMTEAPRLVSQGPLAVTASMNWEQKSTLVAPIFSTTMLKIGKVNEAYDDNIFTVGDPRPDLRVKVGYAINAGYILDQDGHIHGSSPTQTLGTPFVVVAESIAGAVEHTYSIPVYKDCVIGTQMLPNAEKSVPYSFQLQGDGFPNADPNDLEWVTEISEWPYDFVVSVGGLVTGTSPIGGRFGPFSVQLTNGITDDYVTYYLDVFDDPVFNDPATLNFLTDTEVDFDFDVTGWPAPFFTALDTLPGTLALSTVGHLSGQKTGEGSTGPFTIQVDCGGVLQTKDFTFVFAEEFAPGTFTCLAQGGDSTINVSWTQAENASEYQIYKNGTQTITGIDASNNTYLMTGQTNGTAALIKTRAVNLSGSTFSNEVSVTPNAPLVSYIYNYAVSLSEQASGGPTTAVVRSSVATHVDPVDGLQHYALANEGRRKGCKRVQNFFVSSGAAMALRVGKHLCWVEGSGSVALSGAGASGTAVAGTPISFYCTGGNVTATVTGSPTKVQVELNKTAIPRNYTAPGTVQYFPVDTFSGALQVERAGTAPVAASRFLTGFSEFNTVPSTSTNLGADGRYWQRITETNDSGVNTTHLRSIKELSVTLASAEIRCYSIKVNKTFSLRNIRLNVETKVGASTFAGCNGGAFDMTNVLWNTAGQGTYGTTPPTIINTNKEVFTDYTRIWTTVSIPAATYAHIDFQVTLLASSTSSYAGTAGGWIEIDCFQCDKGVDYPTSFQDNADGTRIADDPTVNIAALDSASQIALYARVLPAAEAVKRVLFGIDCATNDIEINLSTSDHIIASIGGTNMDAGAVTETDWIKIAAAFKSAANHVAANGALVTNSTAISKGAATVVHLGCDIAGANGLNGLISEVRIDALPWTQSESIAMTAPPAAPANSIPDSDSRWVNKQDPRQPFAAVGSGYTFNGSGTGSLSFASIPEPGRLELKGGIAQAGEYEVRRDVLNPANGVGKMWQFKIRKDSDPWYSGNVTRRAEIVSGTGRYMAMGTKFIGGFSMYFYPDMFAAGSGFNAYAIDIGDHAHAVDWNTPGYGQADFAVNPCFVTYVYPNNRINTVVRWEPNPAPKKSNVDGNLNGAGSVGLWDDTTLVPNQWWDFVFEVCFHYLATPAAPANAPYIRMYVSKNGGPLLLVGSRNGPNCYNTVDKVTNWKGGLYAWFDTAQYGASPTRTVNHTGYYVLLDRAKTGNEVDLDRNALLQHLRTVRS